MYSNKRIGDFLTRVKLPIDIADTIKYKRITIKINHNGVSMRDEEIGAKIGTKKQFVVRGNDFILSKIDARGGAFGIIPQDLDGAIITGNFWTYEVNKKLIDTDWFYHFTSSNNFNEICERASTGTTHRKYLDEKKFLNFEITLPSVSDQKKIVSQLKEKKEKHDVLVNEIIHQENLVKQLRQSIFQDAVKGILVKQNQKDQSATELLKSIKAEKEKLIKQKKLKKEKPFPPITESEIPFDLPLGWAWCRLGEISTKIGSGSTPLGGQYSANGIPFFRSQNIANNGLDFSDIKYIDKNVHQQMRGTVVLANDILLNITGGSMGRCALVPNDFSEGNVSQHVCIIRLLKVDVLFFHLLMLSPVIQKMIFASTTGAGREGLPKYNLEQFVIPVPPLAEQTRILNKVNELMSFCKQLEQTTLYNKQEADFLLTSILRETFLLSPSKEYKQNEMPISIAAEQ